MRVQATDNKTTTDVDGRFVMLGLQPDEPIVLTAWAEGYFIDREGQMIWPAARWAAPVPMRPTLGPAMRSVVCRAVGKACIPGTLRRRLSRA